MVAAGVMSPDGPPAPRCIPTLATDTVVEKLGELSRPIGAKEHEGAPRRRSRRSRPSRPTRLLAGGGGGNSDAGMRRRRRRRGRSRRRGGGRRSARGRQGGGRRSARGRQGGGRRSRTASERKASRSTPSRYTTSHTRTPVLREVRHTQDNRRVGLWRPGFVKPGRHDGSRASGRRAARVLISQHSTHTTCVTHAPI